MSADVGISSAIMTNQTTGPILNGAKMDQEVAPSCHDSTYDETLIHKTILVGDSGVGKTSFLVQFDQGKFTAGSFSATVGIGFTVNTYSFCNF